MRQLLRRLDAWTALCAWMVVGLVVGLAGCHSTPSLTPQEAEGKHLYQVRCAHCHEDNDQRLKKIPPNLHGIFSQNTFPSGAPASNGELQRVVLVGMGMMPAFAGRFTEEQMTALIAYLHTGLR